MFAAAVVALAVGCWLLMCVLIDVCSFCFSSDRDLKSQFISGFFTADDQTPISPGSSVTLVTRVPKEDTTPVESIVSFTMIHEIFLSEEQTLPSVCRDGMVTQIYWVQWLLWVKMGAQVVVVSTTRENPLQHQRNETKRKPSRRNLR